MCSAGRRGRGGGVCAAPSLPRSRSEVTLINQIFRETGTKRNGIPRKLNVAFGLPNGYVEQRRPRCASLRSRKHQNAPKRPCFVSQISCRHHRALHDRCRRCCKRTPVTKFIIYATRTYGGGSGTLLQLQKTQTRHTLRTGWFNKKNKVCQPRMPHAVATRMSHTVFGIILTAVDSGKG